MRSRLISPAGQGAVVGIASMIGTTIEWYDFFLYSTASALIFNKLFFPNFDSVAGTMASFATYAVGFFMRPVGGALFGHYGDRLGRKSMLLVTLFMMGIPTILIGLLPTYAQIGPWAAVMLVLLRMCQGLALGGEWGGAALMSVEHAPPGSRGLYGSLPQIGVGLGLAISSLAMSVTARLPDASLLAWGWRVPFLASALLLGVGWFIRLRIAESPAYLRLRAGGETLGAPLWAVLRDHGAVLLRAILARMAQVAWFYLVATFSLSYATTRLALPKAEVLDAIVASGLILVVVIPLFGRLADRFGPKRLYIAGALFLMAFAFPYFQLLQARTVPALWAAIVGGMTFGTGLMYAQESLLFAAQFPAQVRYSGISLSIQIAGALGGGLTPIIATALLAMPGGSSHYISAYIIALAALTAVCASGMRDELPT